MNHVTEEEAIARLMREFGCFIHSVMERPGLFKAEIEIPWGASVEPYHSMYTDELVRPIWEAEYQRDHDIDAIRYSMKGNMFEDTKIVQPDTSLRYGKTAWLSYVMSQSTAHVPTQVIYNGVTTIAIFPDGKKIISRPDKEAKFDKETGLAMCIVKHIYGSRAKFLKAIKKANDQNDTQTLS